MAVDNKLYTSIQINGELFSTTDVDKLKLLERELFVDNKNNLWFGKNGKATQVNAKECESSILSINLGNSESVFRINNDDKTANLNGLKFIENKEGNVVSKEIDASEVTSLNNFKLKQSSFENGTFNNGDILQLNNMTLAENKMWGTEIPSNDVVHGQLFFLVSE